MKSSSINFDRLLDVNIKRLTRPKFKHEIFQFNDPTLLERLPDDEETINSYCPVAEKKVKLPGEHINDVAYDSMSSDMTLSYYSHFDKIYQGETFKTILTVMNTSGN